METGHAALLVLARSLGGRTLAEIAGVGLPDSQLHAKGLAGQIVERALGAGGTHAGPDFPELGVEVKTIPVDRSGAPRESTYVCAMTLPAIAAVDWEQSPVRAKLARVLFVPVESDPALPLGARRVGAAFLWSPSTAQEAQLSADWDTIAALVGRGELERLTARLGHCLQVRPKAAHGRARTRALGPDGSLTTTTPRGFYLRATFTAAIVRAALVPPASMPGDR